MLREVHVQVRGTLPLLAVVAEWSGPPGTRHVFEDLEGAMVHRVPGHHGAYLRLALLVVRIRVDLPGGIFEDPTHRGDVGDGTAEVGHNEIGRCGVDGAEEVLDEALRTPVPARRDADGPIPESRTLEVEARPADGLFRGKSRAPEIECLAERVRHTYRLPGIRVSRDDVLGNLDVKEPVSPFGVGGHERPLDQTTPRAKCLLPREVPAVGLESSRRPTAT